MSIVVDISYWQGFLSAGVFSQWKAAGVSRVILKAGGAESGKFVKDSRHDANAAAARSVGLGIDHYFFNGPLDPGQSADQLVSMAGGQAGDLYWFDIENSAGVAHWTPAQALAALQRLKSAHGITGGVYMSSSVVTGADWSQVAAFGAPLWVAQYGSNNGQPQNPPKLKWWSAFAYWQYTSVGRLPGYAGNLDLNQIGPGFSGGGSTPIIGTEDEMKLIYNSESGEVSLVGGSNGCLTLGKADALGEYVTALEQVYGPKVSLTDTYYKVNVQYALQTALKVTAGGGTGSGTTDLTPVLEAEAKTLAAVEAIHVPTTFVAQ